MRGEPRLPLGGGDFPDRQLVPGGRDAAAAARELGQDSHVDEREQVRQIRVGTVAAHARCEIAETVGVERPAGACRAFERLLDQAPAILHQQLVHHAKRVVLPLAVEEESLRDAPRGALEATLARHGAGSACWRRTLGWWRAGIEARSSTMR